MKNFVISRSNAPSVPIHALAEADYPQWLARQSEAHQTWIRSQNFIAEAGQFIALPSQTGTIEQVLLLLAPHNNMWHWAALPKALSASETYSIAAPESIALNEAICGWQCGTYEFTRYKESDVQFATLVIDAHISTDFGLQLAESIFLVRDLINTPTSDMGPEHLAAACKKVSEECDAHYHEIVGDALIEQNFPTIHMVGRASEQAPRLVDMHWGHKEHPKLTLVGKGVCFDTGGLNLKGGKSMGLMKKDMGGAAATLGLARLIMKQKLPVRLRVLIPAVENSVSSNAFRPQDVIKTRKGVTVEIGNTDAEGRLILSDALAEADTEKPDLLIDMATLTGASRVALGPEIPSIFTEDDTLANEISALSFTLEDPLWRLPLWQGYNRYIDSPVADIDNSGSGGGYAGAITAALFLKRFVTESPSWLHIDMMAWNTLSRPGRPLGGEAQGLRTLFTYLKQRYAA